MKTLRNSLLYVCVGSLFAVFSPKLDSVQTVHAFGLALLSFLIFAVWKALDDDVEIGEEAHARGESHFSFKTQLKVMFFVWLYFRGRYWIGLALVLFYFWTQGHTIFY